MSTEQVRQTLANEAQLLENMIENVKAFRSEGFTKQAQFIQGSWGRFLNDRRRTNVALIKAADEDLQKDLETERDQVDAYVKQTAYDPKYTETWKAFLECERVILDHLITLCESK